MSTGKLQVSHGDIPIREHDMKLLKALTALIFLLGAAPVANAKVFSPVGGQGDGGFSSECPAGTFMVGLAGRRGLWMDQIRALCAPMLPSGKFDSPDLGKGKGGGNEGTPVQSFCSSSRLVLGIQPILTEDDRMVAGAFMRCWIPGTDVGAVKTKAIGNEGHRVTWQICRNGEVAVGIHGRSGKHVNAIGLLCGPGPQPAVAAPATEPAPPPANDYVLDVTSFNGVWDTVSSAAGNFTLILKVEDKHVTGNFGHANASLDGTLVGRVAGNGGSFGYTYSQPGIGRTGNGTFQLTDGGRGISGDFFSEQDGTSFHWEGRRRD